MNTFPSHNKLTFNKHINNKIPLAKLSNNTLHRFQHFHPKIRLHLFKIFVLPTLIFSVIPILHNGFKSLKKIQIFQNKHIRHVHSIPWEDFIKNQTLHEDLNLPINQYTKHSIDSTQNYKTEDSRYSII